MKNIQDSNYKILLDVISANATDEGSKKKMAFYLKYFNSVFSCNNSIFNHKVLEEVVKTKGQSLVNGFYNFWNDLPHNDIKTYNDKAFEVGKNIASTPGNVIYENEIMQLIYYTPKQKENYSTPLLIVPPWINKYYILDLQQGNSLVNYLLENGFPVFMISWVNPDKTHAHKDFSNYLLEGPLKAIEVINELFFNASSKSREINILGYCIGGTLVASLLAYLKAKKINNVRSATMFATLVDFSDVGELGMFVDSNQIALLENYMSNLGYFDGNHLRMIFSMLKAEDMIARPFINNYLMGRDPMPFDILYWNADSTNIPYKLHSYCLNNFYLNNLLIKANELVINGTKIDVSKVNLPLYFISTEEDHITPWNGILKGANQFGGDKKFILAASGHVAGIINHPSKNKYHYRSVDITKELTEESVLSNKITQGSWWNEWSAWLEKHSGKKSSSVNIDHSIEKAPGRYSKKRIN